MATASPSAQCLRLLRRRLFAEFQVSSRAVKCRNWPVPDKVVVSTANGSAWTSKTGKAWTMPPQLCYFNLLPPTTSRSSIRSNHAYNNRNCYFQCHRRPTAFFLLVRRGFHSGDATPDPAASLNSSLSRYWQEPCEVSPQSRQGHHRNIHHLRPDTNPLQDLLHASLVPHP
jgi:hypothetical protein